MNGEEAFSEKAIRRKNANNREFRRKRKEIRLRRPDSKAERQKRARIKIVNGFGNRDGRGKAAEPEQRERLYQIRFYRGVRSMNGEEAFSEKAIRRKNANNREFRRKRKEIRLRRPDSKAERQKRARIKIVNGFGNRDGRGKAAEPEQRERLYQIRFYRGVRSMNG